MLILDMNCTLSQPLIKSVDKRTKEVHTFRKKFLIIQLLSETEIGVKKVIEIKVHKFKGELKISTPNQSSYGPAKMSMILRDFEAYARKTWPDTYCRILHVISDTFPRDYQ